MLKGRGFFCFVLLRWLCFALLMFRWFSTAWLFNESNQCMSWCFQLLSVAAVLCFLMSPSACPRIEWGSSEEHEASGGHHMWPKQKLWKMQLSLILKGKTQQLKWKNPAWKAPKSFSHKSSESSALFLFTGNSKLFDLKMAVQSRC